MKLIGIYSPVMQSGKTTIARHMHLKYGYTIRPFAKTLKDMTSTFLSAMGIQEHIVDEMIFGTLKDKAIPSLGVTPRHIMQTLGTAWGRDMINQDVWVKVNIAGANDYTVIDDVRFPNEFAAIKKAGGEMWKVIRPGNPMTADSQLGEGLMDDGLEYMFDRTFSNTGTIDDLRNRVDETVSAHRLFEAQEWGAVE
jgi:hypothetical protein